MPNWSDENGRFWFTKPGDMWYNSVEIPHPPVVVEKNCRCEFCVYKREQKRLKQNRKKL